MQHRLLLGLMCSFDDENKLLEEILGVCDDWLSHDLRLGQF